MSPTDLVYIVVCSLPGCVPNDPADSVLFRTREEAEEYIDSEKEADLLFGYTEEDDQYTYDILPITWAHAQEDGWEEEDLL